MIDFRYHLISLIGVILALALGILAGSGFLGGPILEQLQEDVDNFRTEARELQTEITDQDVKLDQAQEFAEAVEPLVARGRLSGEQVVLFQFEGTEARLVDGVRESLSVAGAEIVSQITLSKKFELGSQPAEEELSLVTGSLGGEPATLLEETATLLGQRAAAAAADQGQTDAPNTTAAQRFESLLADLEAAEFVGSDLAPEGRAIPIRARFIVIGGSEGRPPFPLDRFVSTFAAALAERDAPTMVLESSTSAWELVNSVRTDIVARARVATVDNSETTVGRIAVVLGLEEVIAGSVGHFGIKPGRTAMIPDLTTNE